MRTERDTRSPMPRGDEPGAARSERCTLTASEVDRLMYDLDVDRRTPEQLVRDRHRALLAIRKRVIRVRQRVMDRGDAARPKPCP